MIPGNPHRSLAVAATIVVAGAVIAGLATMDSPARQRQQKLDAHRVEDLKGIQSAINTYWRVQGALPQDLSTLASSFRVETADPDIGGPYSYEVESAEAYRLCAVFSVDSREQPSPTYYTGAPNWAHGVGRSCFELKVAKTN